MNEPSLRTLRRLIWVYFWLLLFEGALRKWVFPQLSGVLLIIRDPVVMVIYAVALRERVFPRSAFIWWTAILAVLSFAVSFAGRGTLPVTLYGLRADFLHLPMILLIRAVLRPSDVRRIGFALLLTLPAMMVLAILQFKGGPDSRWNVGAGGEIGGQLYVAEGKVRASGTFSFVTGMASYLALCTAYLLYGSWPRRSYPQWLSLSALPALVLTLVISGSRAAVLLVAIVCAIMLTMGLRRPGELGAAVRPILLATAAYLLLAWLAPIFNEGLAIHRDRFEGGGGLKEGILYRYGHEFESGWHALLYTPLTGMGIGIGTNAGAHMLAGEREFLLGEGEWERVMMESGPILGPAYLALRFAALVLIARTALASFQEGRSLPLLLTGVAGLDLVNGQFGQPTALGFAVFTAGLALAAAREEDFTEAPPEPPALAVAVRTPGRSPYAERLHGGNGNDPEP